MSGSDFSIKMKDQAVESLDALNIEYELFDGVLGRKGIDILKEHGVAPSAYVEANDWTDGTIGCLASHYELWHECAQGDEPFMILEQDAVVLRDPEEILGDIDSVCHLDAYLPFENIKTGFDHSELYNENVQIYAPGVKRYPKNKFYKNNAITGSVFRGAYGYIMTPKGAKRVLDFISKRGAFPADRCLCEAAAPIQRSSCTYVRLNPFFKSLDIQRKHSSRDYLV